MEPHLIRALVPNSGGSAPVARQPRTVTETPVRSSALRTGTGDVDTKVVKLGEAKVAQLVRTLFSALKGSALVVFVSIGHKIGLMIGQGLATSTELAEAAGLHERYVRE